jgi:cyclopropane-fatty-acyl-phospholipid synthase
VTITAVSSPTLHADLAHPDPMRWPHLARVPHSPLRARAVQEVLRRSAQAIGICVRLADGRAWGRTDGPVLELRRPDEFFARVGHDGLIGFGESWMTGAWHAPDPVAVLERFAEWMVSHVPTPFHRLLTWLSPKPPVEETNTVAQSPDNIRRHYDLSNEMFALFLDESMTYSSALFEPGDSLHAAQLRKVDAVLDAAHVQSGSRVLEIGSGWGELAIRAAQRGATVTTITLSPEQKSLAEQRIAAAGQADRVTVLLQDYRVVEGEFDAVVSVEMIEAVGEEYWPDYFGAIDRLVAPGGRAAVQAIVMPDKRLDTTRDAYTWLQKYIFPGGLIPSIEAVNRALASATRGLRVVQQREFGLHYAQTLRMWRERFLARSDDILRLGFDRTFIRMWEYYLASCEAGFRARYLAVSQLTLAREVV